MSLSITVAAPFKNLRKDALKKHEFIYYLAIDRRWMNRDEAEALIKIAQEQGLLEAEDDEIRPTFDVKSVEVPLGFKPSSEIFSKRDHTQELIARIAEQRGTEPKVVVAEMNALIEDHFAGNLRVEAAIVLMARKYDVPFEDKLEFLKKTCLKQ